MTKRLTAFSKHVRLSNEYGQLLAEKTMELGNLTLVTIVLTPLVPGYPFNENFAFLGFAAFFLCHAFAYYVMKGGGS